jgi:hypothetical protein
MKNLIIFSLALVAFTSSCALTSNTIIKANDSFILGNNQHGSFSVKLKNVSKENITVYQAPIGGGTHSPNIVKPNQVVRVSVDKNTALVVANKSLQTVSVDLKVVGDLGLSMGYKN